LLDKLDNDAANGGAILTHKMRNARLERGRTVPPMEKVV